MEMKIEQLTVKDIKLLISLRMEVLADVFKTDFKNMTSSDIENLKRENKKYYLKELPSGRHIACAAYETDKILGCGGMCLYNEMPSPDNPNGKCAYLMNIYVKPEYRKKGLGKKICNWLVEKAKETGAEKIYLESSDNAKPMYEKLGFKEMKNYMAIL